MTITDFIIYLRKHILAATDTNSDDRSALLHTVDILNDAAGFFGHASIVSITDDFLAYFNDYHCGFIKQDLPTDDEIIERLSH